MNKSFHSAHLNQNSCKPLQACLRCFMVIKCLSICIFMMVIICGIALGQNNYYYPAIRPAGIDYKVYKTPHFQIIYQEGSEVEAWQAGVTLEGELDHAYSLFDVTNQMLMPLILNNFNDLSNGYVSTHPFRQEIEIPHLKGSSLGIGYHSWIDLVATHELIHAVQANADSPLGFGSITRWIAPDNARIINLLLPIGLTEGAAVYTESKDMRSGRLNDPRFLMLYRAAATSKRPWSLSQLMEHPGYGFHRGRAYIGGATFYSWQHGRDEGQFFSKMRSSIYRFPLRLTGRDLSRTIGKPLTQIKKEFRDETTITPRSSSQQSEIISSQNGVMHRWPQWLNDKTLVVYRTAFNETSGLYTIDTESKAIDLLFPVLLPSDSWFTVSDSVIIYSRYVPDRFSGIKMTADVFSYNIATKQHSRITKNGRIHMPVMTSSGIWALQNDGQRNKLVSVDPLGNIQTLRDRSQADLIQIAPSQAGTAVLVRHNQTQSVYLVEEDGKFKPWIAVNDGSIREMSWISDGRYFLFTADIGDVTNVYCHDLLQNRTMQLTDVMYGALDPILSQDLQTLVYVDYQHENYRVVSEMFSPETSSTITLKAISEIPEISPKLEVPESFTSTPYSLVSHLRPRMLIPVYDYSLDAPRRRLGLGLGLAIHGSDPLRKLTYSTTATIQKNRVWGHALLRSAFGPVITTLGVENQPEAYLVRVSNSDGSMQWLTIGEQSQGVSLSFAMPIEFERNVRRSNATIFTRIIGERSRWFSLNEDPVPFNRATGESLSEFRRRTHFEIGATVSIGVQRNLRDVWPNRGSIIGVNTRNDIYTERGARRSGLNVSFNQFWSFSRKSNTGLNLIASMLTQNSGVIYSRSAILPRGHEMYIGRGTHFKIGVDLIQPIWYIEDGFLTIPSYFKLLYAYGFIERLLPDENHNGIWSAGIGIGLQFRLIHFLDMEVRGTLNPFDVKKSYFALF